MILRKASRGLLTGEAQERGRRVPGGTVYTQSLPVGMTSLSRLEAGLGGGRTGRKHLSLAQWKAFLPPSRSLCPRRSAAMNTQEGGGTETGSNNRQASAGLHKLKAAPQTTEGLSQTVALYTHRRNYHESKGHLSHFRLGTESLL